MSEANGQVLDYDVVVIGAGPAGENLAGRCADHGMSTAIVERELVGGECSYWGCIPSKTLLRPGGAREPAGWPRGSAGPPVGRQPGPAWKPGRHKPQSGCTWSPA